MPEEKTAPTDAEILETARTRRAACVAAEAEDRDLAKEDVKFAHGDQWPESIRAEREEENKPCLTINRTQRFVKQVVNDIRQIRPAIKIRGVDSQSDPETAEIMTGLIRAIENTCNAEIAYDWAAECSVTSGKGYFRISTEYSAPDSFDQDVVVRRIRNRFSVYLDYRSKEPDGSDAKFGFVDKFMPKKEFEEKYPGKATSATGLDVDGLDDWYTGDDVLVSEYWELEETPATLYLLVDGTVSWIKPPDGFEDLIANTRQSARTQLIQRIITGQDILETKHYQWKYIPIVPVLGEEVDIEGKQFLQGMVRDMKDPQRMYNYMRSASAERVALGVKAQWIGPQGAFSTSSKWRNAHKKAYPFLEWSIKAVKAAGGVTPQFIPPPEISPGLIQEQQTAAEELKAMPGIFDAGLGDRSNEVSGIAIKARNVRSDVGNFHYVDNLGRAIRHAGRIIIDIIPTIYSKPRVVKILKPNGDEDSVTVNERSVNKKTGKQYNFDLRVGKYDAVVDVGPSYATQRQEAVESMLEIVKAFPQAVPVLGDILAKNMDWPEADEISKRLKLLQPAEIAADENPEVRRMMQQNKQITEQAQQYIQYLEQKMQEMAQALNDKQGDLRLKAMEIQRKRDDMMQRHAREMTELELEHNSNVPGAVV